MIKTNNFIQTLTAKGLVDDAIVLENGYDIQYKGNIVSVRLNNKGGALIYNQKKNDIIEIQSGRLDEVLHKYIVQSLFGIQTKTGTRGMECKDVFLVPTKVIKNNVIFEDSVGRHFSVSGVSPEAILSYYKEACEVNADDSLILLSGFAPYDRYFKESPVTAETSDVEVQLLKCNVNTDDYAVSPRSECINDVGQTVVGNFLCSSADKINLMTFEEDSAKMFTYKSSAKRNISSSTMRTKNPFAIKAKEALNQNRRAVMDYAETKYPYGLCLSAMEQMLAYDSSAIFSSMKIDSGIEYKNLYLKYLKNATSVQFRLDSNKSIFSAITVAGKSVAKFRATPIISDMHNSLKKDGYYLSELENGLEFNINDPAVSAIVSSCKNFTPVSEKVLNKPNAVSKVIGSNCTKILADYGINDKKQVFQTLVQVVIN